MSPAEATRPLAAGKHRSPAQRALIYTAAGFASEVVFSAVHDMIRGRPLRFRTSPWMLPIYSLILPLYEPLHDRLRDRPPPARAAAYGAGFLAVEYTSGWILKRLTGAIPWDYAEARFGVHDLVRLDYLPWWATVGLALEHLHDALLPEGKTFASK